jgi:periplasmic divalent cation tolerance protein
MEPILLYITASTREEAISISHELLGLRLVACTNISEHITSMYHWQNEIEHKSEAVIVAKSLRMHLEAIVAKVKGMHSYNIPCIIAMPILGGNQDFLDWAVQEMKTT